jgi:hypothetical protein
MSVRYIDKIGASKIKELPQNILLNFSFSLYSPNLEHTTILFTMKQFILPLDQYFKLYLVNTYQLIFYI